MRLRRWVADRSRWTELLDLIDQLPTTSRIHAAIVNDPEQAEWIVAASGDEPAKKWSPPLTEFTLEAQTLAARR